MFSDAQRFHQCCRFAGPEEVLGFAWREVVQVVSQPGTERDLEMFVNTSNFMLQTTNHGLVACLAAVVATFLGMSSWLVAFRGIAAQGPSPSESSNARSPSLRLVLDDTLLDRLRDGIPRDFHVTPKSQPDPEVLLDGLAAGDTLVWVGEGRNIPKVLWVGTFRPAMSVLAITGAPHAPLGLASPEFRPSQISSAYIRPAKEMPYHNVDEEPRAEFLPLLEARDRFGQVVGYPTVLMHYYASSSVLHRFAGSECLFYLFDRPAAALDAAGWMRLLKNVASRFRAHLQLQRVSTEYGSYRLGEHVLIRVRVTNLRPQAAATELHLYAQEPGAAEFRSIASVRRCPDGKSESEAVADFAPQGKPGLWTTPWRRGRIRTTPRNSESPVNRFSLTGGTSDSYS